MKNFTPRALSPDASSTAKQFSLRHVFRAGAIVWCKHKGKDYYVVFKSLSRPNRGIQIPRGLIEREENFAEAVLREVKEESGIDARIVCPLGYIFFENPTDNYSNLQIYYIVRPTQPIDVTKKWSFIDTDGSEQRLEVWCEPASRDASYLAAGQSQVVEMFQKWLKDHKKSPKKHYNKRKQSQRNKQDSSESQSQDNAHRNTKKDRPRHQLPQRSAQEPTSRPQE